MTHRRSPPAPDSGATLADERGENTRHTVSSTLLPPAVTKRGSKAAQPRCRGDTALHGAAAKGNPGACRLLIQADADIDIGSNSDGFTPLMRACEYDELACAEVLLDMGAKINAVDHKGHTALHWAFIHSPRITKLLLEHGAKPCAWNCLKCKLHRRGAGAADDGARDTPPKPHDVSATRSRGAAPIKPVDKSKLSREELDRLDVATHRQIVSHDPHDANWIAFTAAEAPWVPMSVDPAMQRHFAARESIIGLASKQDAKVLHEWITKSEEHVHTWVVRGILESEKRAAHFRALGRGWIFVQLSSQQGVHTGKHDSTHPARKITRFKWWFEGVERVLRNRQDEFPAMRIAPDEVSKWTTGYVHGAELIFVLRGMVATVSLMARVKLRADYHREHVWASTDEVQQAVEAREPTDAERVALAKKAEALAAKKKAKRERQRARKAEEVAARGVELELSERERAEGEKAATAFEELLAEMKM